LFSKAVVKIFDFLASLELAVTIILALAVILSVGTIYESKYGAAVASQVVYRSFWMQALLWILIVNLAAVAFSRMPWRKHHIGFLVTHLGIIVLLVGSWVQQQRGVDGVLALAPGEKSQVVRLEENMLYVFKTIPGQAYDLVLEQRLNFDLRRNLTSAKTYSIKGEDQAIKVLQYFPKAGREVVAENVAMGKGVSAFKLRLLGSRATFNDWMFLQPDTGTTNQVGPAVIRFVKEKPDLRKAPEKATLYLYQEGGPELPPKIAVARAGQPFRELGRAPIGKNIPLGWMDFEMVLDSYHASAIPRASYFPLTTPVPGFDGYQVVEVELAGEKLWLELGASGQVSSGDALYYVQFTRRQVDLGFELGLKKFEIGYYEGTTRPKTYSSEVEVLGQTHLISMNEPLHHGGYTFYQASYELDDEGSPRLSVLSVNYDPGRWVKYLGSLMLTLGILLMFYFKPKYTGSHKLLKKKETPA
jgi:hypothetical protein